MNREVGFTDLVGSKGLFIDGDWVESKDQDPKGDVRLIQLADIGVGNYIDKSSRFLNTKAAARLKCTILQAGDILIARMPDPIGRACVFPGDKKECCTVVDICILRINEKIVDKNWLLHRINSQDIQRQISGWITGTTRQRISRGNLSKIRFDLPPLKEQRRIAAILDKADAIRRKRQRAIELTEIFLRSVFLDMFGDPKKNWEPVNFVQVALPEKNSFVNGPFGSNLLTTELQDSGVPVVYIQDIRNGRYLRKSNRHVTEIKAKELRMCNVIPGDVLVAKVGDPPGAAAIYPDSGKSAIVTQDVVRIRPNLKKITPEFLTSFFNSEAGFRWLAPIIVEATRSRFGLGDIKKQSFLIPPLALQMNYSRIYRGISERLDKISVQLAELEILISSLQQCAFKGELPQTTTPLEEAISA